MSDTDAMPSPAPAPDRRRHRFSHRLRLEGVLVAETAVHVGGADDDTAADLPLARDGLGRLYVPGTSLAGALRAASVPHLDAEPLWGRPDGDTATEPGTTSFILVEDAIIDAGVAPEARDGVGIDRYSGTAARGIKFERPVLPAGTGIPLCLTLEVGEIGLDRAKAWLGALSELLASGSFRIGAAGTRGLGRLRLTAPRISQQDWSTRDGVLALLQARLNGGWGQTIAIAPSGRNHHGQAQVLAIEIDWRPALPVMVAANAGGAVIDTLPLLTRRVDGGLAPLLPGSAIKGVLRSHAERIVRTVTRDDPPRDAAFDAQIRPHPLIEHLFGRGGPKIAADRAAADDAWLPGRGALSVMDCQADAPTFDPAAWQRMASVDRDDADPCQGLRDRDGREVRFRRADHVTIDRWTGGAADNLLFNAVEPWGVDWPAMRLELDWNRLPRAGATPVAGDRRHQERLAALALLVLTLDDLRTGWLTLGYGGNRGYGEIRLAGIRLSGMDPVTGGTLDGMALDTRLPDWRPMLETAWRTVLVTPADGDG